MSKLRHRLLFAMKGQLCSYRQLYSKRSDVLAWRIEQQRSIMSSKIEKQQNIDVLAKKMSLRRTDDYRDLKKLLSSSNENNSEQGDFVVSVDIRERFFQLCSSFLGGAWKSITSDQMLVTHIKGGMTNMLFLCELPDFAKKMIGDESDKTLLRIYFNPETENRLVAESVIFTLLSERNLGPRLYGVFNEGRLEEFIVSNTLVTSDIWEPEMSRMIAAKLAKMHQMILPISKDPTYLFEAIERWLVQLQNLCPDVTVPIKNSDNSKVLNLGDLMLEYQQIKKALTKSTSSIAFCHNDLQEGNVLLPLDETSTSKDLVIIDFEYASYNYRAFDFANHFCEWAINYTTPTPPFFTITEDHFPTTEQQKNFVRSYLMANHDDYSNQSVDEVIDEIRPFFPMPHFFWGIWSLVQRELSPVNFGFDQYAKQRLNIYFKQRDQLLSLL